MFMIVAGCAVLFSDNVNAAEGDPVTVEGIDGEAFPSIDAALTAAQNNEITDVVLTLSGNATVTAKNLLISGITSLTINGGRNSINATDTSDYIFTLSGISDVKINNVTINSGINVYKSTVEMNNVTINYNAKVGLVVGNTAYITMSESEINCTADSAPWGANVNFDKGSEADAKLGTLTVDKFENIGSVYGEHGVTDVNIEDGGQVVQLTVGTGSGEDNSWSEYWSSFDDANAVYEGMMTALEEDAGQEEPTYPDAQFNVLKSTGATEPVNLRTPDSSVDTSKMGNDEAFLIDTKVTGGKIVGDYTPGESADVSETNTSGATVTYDDKMPLTNNIIAVYQELSINGDAYVSGTNSTLTIPEGKTLRIMSGGDLDLNGNTVVVNGTLIIEDGATVSNTGTIVITRGCTFENSGVIGVGGIATITADIPAGTTTTYDGHGSVDVSNVSGMTFGFTNTTASTDDRAQYTLTVSGNLYAEATENNAVSIDGARITGDFYIGQDVEVSIKNADVRNGVTITVDGVLNTNDVLYMYNGSEIIVNGAMNGKVIAYTGDFKTSEKEDSLITDNSTTSFSIKANGNDYVVSGYTLSVGSYTYQYDPEDDGTTESWTAQRLYISGTLAYVLDYGANTPESYSANLTIEGDGAVVAEGSTLTLPYTVIIKNTGSPIEVLGMIQVNGSNRYSFDYVGTSYTVTVTGSNASQTTYVTTFDAAMGAIASADRQSLTVMGSLDIESEYTVATGQIINFPGADVATSQIVIKENGSLTVEQRATVNGEIDNVLGVMTVYKPSGCSAPLAYATMTEGTADGINYTRYAGLLYAINNSNPGDEISVVGPATVDGNLTIPSDVTVTVENPLGSLTVSGNLTIEAGATLAIQDEKTLVLTGQRSTVTVNGTLDLTEGKIAFQYKGTGETNTALTSTVGKTLWGLTQDIEGENLPDKFNTVAYYDENNQIIMTSPEAAIEATSAQDVNKYVVVSGNVNAGDLDLTVDMRLRNGANVTFGTVTISEDVDLYVSEGAKITATISGQTGVDGSEVASTVELESVEGEFLIGETDVIDDQNVTTHQLYIAGSPSGTIEVIEGTAVVGAASVEFDNETYTTYTTLNVNKVSQANVTFTVASGATLQVNDNMRLESGVTGTNGDQPAVIIDGTLAVAESGTVTVDGIMDVAGTMTVAAGNTTDVTVAGTLNVTGTLDISTAEDDEASIEVEGTLVAGDKITTMGGSSTGTVNGTVLFKNNGSLKAYNGASVEGAVIGGDAKHTAFYINGNLYMTVYSDDTDITDSYLAGEDFALVGYDMSVAGGYDIETLGDWYSDSEMTKPVTSASVGNPEAMYFKVNASNVDVKISVGQGISLYVDNIRYVSGETVSLSVGTHSVTATVNPGFTGDVTVQFNGQTVTGEFTITPEMASNTYEGNLSLTATGNITQESVVIDGGNGDSGMGLTDYLLIILVVLIVIMAIMVAMRLMRS